MTDDTTLQPKTRLTSNAVHGRGKGALVRFTERLPDTTPFFRAHFSDGFRQWILLIFVAFVLRVGTFGDPNLHVDEAFYFLVGQRMHDGALLYVDVWDRKPLGLFLIYYAIAAFSHSVVAYQVVSLGFATATAMVVNLIARRWTNVQGGLFAGCAYLFMLGPLQGFGGQSPVFYNLFVALAAWWVICDEPRLSAGKPGWKTFAAMLSCGLALTIKQTTIFESVFLGLFASWLMARSAMPRPRLALTMLGFALFGAFPTLAISAYYVIVGHWAEYWQAMVTSNLTKPVSSPISVGYRIFYLFVIMFPVLGVAFLGAISNKFSKKADWCNWFLWLWLVTAFCGFFVVPNAYLHYALPLLVPLCVASAGLLSGVRYGPLVMVFVASYALGWFLPLDFRHTQQSTRSMTQLARFIEEHDSGGGLFIFDGPAYLYSMTRKPFLTPLVFPHHLNHAIERNVSHLDTREEMRRIIRNKPGVVVMAVFPRNRPVNEDSRERVKAYVFNNCQLVGSAVAYELNRQDYIAVYGDCREGAPDMEID